MTSKYFFVVFVSMSAGLADQPQKNITASLINQSEMISCGPDIFRELDSSSNGKFIPLLPGWGNHKFEIKTSSDSAGYYFNQGITMYYSYHSREAVASFREAVRFDSNSAICYWGEALAMGPNYNSAHFYKTPPGLPAAIKKMNAFAVSLNGKEKDLVAAMNTRYDIIDTLHSRKELNENWSVSLKKLMIKYPADQEIKALYVDAIMLQHPWDFWFNSGQSKPWTNEIAKLCMDILRVDPSHPAALHYYIHITEASRNPSVALPAADKLKQLFPGVAHMVHMSSHEYERNGLFAKGVEVNERSDDALGRYESLVKNIGLNRHVPHYFSVEAFCALSGAIDKKGMPIMYKLRSSVVPDKQETYKQFLYMMPELAMVRLGKWEEILADTTQPDSSWANAIALMAFSKGMAYAQKGNITEAKKSLEILIEKEKDNSLAEVDIPFNSPLDALKVAENILRGSIYFSSNKNDSAIACLNKAIGLEDKLIYSEPKQWVLPARQYLGYFYLKINKPIAAEKIYRQDLIWNPGNGWAAVGLYQSLLRQKKAREAEFYKAIYLKSFSAADRIPAGSVYF